MTRATRFRSVVLTAVLVASARLGSAQTAQVSGFVRDASEALVSGAEVTVTQTDTGVDRKAVSNVGGYYLVPFLPPGRYKVAVRAQGFKPVDREGITLAVDQAARVDFVLELGQLTDAVEVTADAPLLETESSSLGQVVSRRAIVDLPLNGRNYLQLAKLAAGVVEPPAGDRAITGGSFVANGVRATLNNFILDGVDNNSRIVDIQNSSNVVIQPSVDALSEFSVQTHNFSAEFGYSAGAVVNAVIKSGDNTFHGSAFEFARNDALDARNYFSNPAEKKPELKRNQFGGTVGGPIVRNKTFFFASWERTRETRGLTFLTTVPTAAMRGGDFSGERTLFDPATTRTNPAGAGSIRDPFPGNRIPAVRIDPAAAKVLALIPLPNIAGAGAVNNYSTNKDREDHRDQVDVRLDHSFSARSKLFARFSFGDFTSSNPGPFDPPLIGSSQFQQSRKDQSAQQLAAGHTFVFSAATVNEVRFGYNRIRDNLLPFVGERIVDQFGIQGIPSAPGVTGLPQITVAGFAPLGEATFLPNNKLSRTYQVNDNLSLLKGRHSIKLGVNYRYIQSTFDVSGAARGSFTFNGAFTQSPQSRTTTGSPFADFLLGTAQSATVSNTFTGDLRNHYLGAYVQDAWRLGRKLTVNLGVRYEIFTQPYEVDDKQANFLVDQRKLMFPENAVPSGMPASLVTTIPSGVPSRSLIKTDFNNVAPRIGIAYQLGKSTALRAGIGIFYADHPSNGASTRLVGNPPFRVNAVYATDSVTPRIILGTGFPPSALDTVQF
ncbi:MAG TPA: TonB-dependent receptor, partial [Gemmatimonadales bacterium]|nr:TonB-dependent receptor [Gemmatimonadales bacterium]